MLIEYQPSPDRFRGTGTVFIAWEPEDHDYFKYWDSLPQALHLLEQMPRTRSLEEAIEWGRQRTSRVLIRPESDPGEYCWAGVGEPKGSDAELETARLLGPFENNLGQDEGSYPLHGIWAASRADGSARQTHQAASAGATEP